MGETGFADLAVDVGDDFVATVEIRRPPNNFFDVALVGALADAYEALARDGECRAIVLCSAGKHFCAGADFGSGSEQGGAALYRQAARVFAAPLPVVAAVQGAAVGGGLGLACSADFRVASPDARFSANFAQLGFHHGFALSVEAAGIGLCDRLVDSEALRAEAHGLAASIGASAPLAVRSIRATMRADLVDRVVTAMDHEAAEQERLRHTADWSEGVAAMAERRRPRFEGR